MRKLGAAAIVALALSAHTANAQHTWTVQSFSPGAAGFVNVSENELMTGTQWDTDGTDACPPQGPDDVRCEWLQDHIAGDYDHMDNGVLGANLNGATAGQNVVFSSDVWSDPNNLTSNWKINYDAHFIVANPADLNKLRITTRYKFAGATMLTLVLSGQAGTVHVEYQVSPTHTWPESPETGNAWTIDMIPSRTTAGSPASIWFDNIVITESASTLFTDDFPLSAAAVPGGSPLSLVSGLSVSPNPLSSDATLRFDLAQAGLLRLEVFDAGGRLVRSLLNSSLGAGAQSVVWDGLDARGEVAPSGIYMFRASGATGATTAKAIKLVR